MMGGLILKPTTLRMFLKVCDFKVERRPPRFEQKQEGGEGETHRAPHLPERSSVTREVAAPMLCR